MEAWRQVVGFEGRYEVSDAGNVWSCITRRVLSPAPTSRGYLTVNLYFSERPKRRKSECVHDLVSAAFIGPKPKGLQVDHIDGNKRNNSADNLRYVTQSENVKNAVRNGRINHEGVASHNAKLTADDVREIRRMAAAGELRPESHARKLGVSYFTVHSVVKWKTYRHVI